MSLGQFLKQSRKRSGFSSAKSFYSLVSKQLKPSFNYSYYTRIESDAVVPSKLIIEELAACLDQGDQEALILLWCEVQFPKYRRLFKRKTFKPSQISAANIETERVSQHELSERQVSCVMSSFEHYQVFLLLTLSRAPVSLEDLGAIFDFDVRAILSDLQADKLAIKNGNLFEQASIEMRFPKPSTKSLRDLFKRAELWNRELRESLGFETSKEKFFIRRISQRHYLLITGFLDQIDNLVRATDELDVSLNDEVFIFEYSLSTGRMPG